LEQVTTASLDALRRYAEGRRANNTEGNYAKAAKLLEEAVALDTTVAMAYRSLGVAYVNLNFPRERRRTSQCQLVHANCGFTLDVVKRTT
jgi:hypothetical protein